MRLEGIIPAPIMDPELAEETRERLALILVAINGVIFLISGGFGYFLAGRTLRPIQEMLNEQNQFVADASHELRTPLASLKIAMEVSLRDKKLTLKDAKQLVSENIKEVDRLQSLSDGLLRLARYPAVACLPAGRAGGQNLNGNAKLENVSLSDIVKQAIRKTAPLAKEKGIILDNNVVSEATIKGNADDLVGLLVILLDNAVKYSSEKTSVKIGSHKTDGVVSITVEDHGAGIEEKDIPHIFDRFYRADSSRSATKGKGYGLGLSIAKKIVEAHHGSIAVESKAGKGSIFTVRIPASFAKPTLDI
ncbi:MAG: HAMP domain-containing sensor histidine kinase [bacterium]|nr:HAMP domain-containing sensor histidine kinase [bacterium]